MGNTFPVPDERMQKIIDLLRLENKHISKMWSCFRRFDKDRSGSIDIDEFYLLVEEERTVFGDSIFELCDIESNGTLDFSEFVTVLSTYCMFGRQDVLKFCFFVFDKDKNGYIEQDELIALVEMLHGNNPNANCKTALDKFDTNCDGKIDFDEFTALNNQYPMLLFPAFRIQESMMNNSMGELWWKSRKVMLENERKNRETNAERLKLKELQRTRAKAKRDLRRKMGISYYLLFWRRNKVAAQIAADEALRKERRDRRREKELEERKALSKQKSLAKLFNGDADRVAKAQRMTQGSKKQNPAKKLQQEVAKKEKELDDRKNKGTASVIS